MQHYFPTIYSIWFCTIKTTYNKNLAILQESIWKKFVYVVLYKDFQSFFSFIYYKFYTTNHMNGQRTHVRFLTTQHFNDLTFFSRELLHFVCILKRFTKIIFNPVLHWHQTSHGDEITRAKTNFTYIILRVAWRDLMEFTMWQIN